MISAPRGLLRLVALQLFSQSSLSGAELQEQIRRTSSGAWRPGPGSIYFLLEELRREELVVELPKRGGTVRRYVIATKGKSHLERLKREVDGEVRKQLEILAYSCEQAGDLQLGQGIKELLSPQTSRPGR